MIGIKNDHNYSKEKRNGDELEGDKLDPLVKRACIEVWWNYNYLNHNLLRYCVPIFKYNISLLIRCHIIQLNKLLK